MTRPRTVRSFVIRGKMTRAQKRAYENLLPKYGIPFAREKLNLRRIFAREAPVIVEIGFGMGEATAEIAEMHPENNYLGIEVFKAGVGSLLRHIAAKDLQNVRIIHHDAVEVMQFMVQDKSIAGVHIFFPDPWPKKRHHKRRLIQPPFVNMITNKLIVGGYIHICTDWQDYAEQILSTLENEPGLQNTGQGFVNRPRWRPSTKFEKQGLQAQHPVWDVQFKKVG